MLDRAMQALYLLALDPVAETFSDPNSYGFRKERSCADAGEQLFIVLSRTVSPQWILEGDIKGCFNWISHSWLLRYVPMDKGILEAWLKSGYIENSRLYSTETGTPQGGIISAVLANLALNGMEGMLREKFPGSKVNLIRYADDFVVTADSKELLEQEIKPMIAEFLLERGLELSEEKTCITHIEQGFDFLGQNIRKYNGKLIIKPSKSNVAAFLADIRELVKNNKATSAGELIRLLNPKIKGWAMYHRHVCSKETFQDVDHEIFKVLAKWAKRRHPKKSHRWITDKYYTHIPGPNGGHHWIFFGETINRDGRSKPMALMKAALIPIRRHIKIRGNVNPYSPEWKQYLALRHERGARYIQSEEERTSHRRETPQFA